MAASLTRSWWVDYNVGTLRGRDYPTRVPVAFRRKHGQIVLDQIRCVDKTRLVKRLGKIDGPTAERVLAVLGELFAP
jgi:mRNA interferase MazF